MKKLNLGNKRNAANAAVLAAVMLIAAAAGCACGDKSEQPAESAVVEEAGYRDDVSCADIQAAVAGALGDNYWPNMDIPAEFLAETYGVTEDLHDEYIAQMPMISTNVDTLIVVKAKEGSEQAVEDALNAYHQMMVDDTMQYPMNLGKIQAGQVKTFGRYVCFVQLGADVMTQMEEGDEAVIAHCEQENAKALEAIEGALTK